LAFVAWFAADVQSEFAFVGPGRAHGLGTDLAEYLTWGHYTDASKFLELATAQPVNDGMDFTSFFGSVGLVLLVYAALVEKSSIFRAFLIVLVWIAAFSVAASGVAHFAYYLPGMHFFRHIGYVVGSIKWIAIIISAYGLMSLAKSSPRPVPLLIAINVGIALFVGSEIWYFANMLHGPEWARRAFVPLWIGRFHVVAAAALFLLLLGTLLSFIFERISLYKLVAVIALCELVGYRAALSYRYPVDPGVRAEFANAEPLTYQPERVWPSEAPRFERLESIAGSPVHYDVDAAFADIDLCGSDANVLLSASNLVMPEVKDLFDTWRTADEQTRSDRLTGPDRNVLLEALGCHAPKLRLVSNPIFAPDIEAARKLIGAHADIFARPVIIAPDTAAAVPGVAVAGAGGKIEITKFSANAIDVTIANATDGVAWLVYDDAYSAHAQAQIDGRSQKIYQANLAFKAIPIPPGRHQVRFEFERGSMGGLILVVGAGLFALTLWMIAMSLVYATDDGAERRPL
jgi:hypothetical protein